MCVQRRRLTVFVSCVACAANRFQCANHQQCVYYWNRCDGYAHCIDGSDEIGCGKLLCAVVLWKNVDGAEHSFMFRAVNSFQQSKDKANNSDEKKPKVEIPRWRPLNCKYLYLSLYTRWQRNSNGYTHVFGVQLSKTYNGNVVRYQTGRNWKWKFQDGSL